jgi:Tol biopolymer transport system component
MRPPEARPDDARRQGSERSSPDGTRIAFESGRDDAGREIYVRGSDGSNPTRLTFTASDVRAAWSPAGARITFTSDRDGNDEIFVMNAEGAGRPG